MSAPVIWIIIPIGLGAGLILLRGWIRLTNFLTMSIAILLAILAWQMPIGSPIILSPWSWFPSIEIPSTLLVLGRRFIIDNPDRPLLMMVFLSLAYWVGGSQAVKSSRMFAPIGFIISGLFTAALAVEPFLYAAPLLLMASLVSIPLLAPPGKPVGASVIRFLIFQCLSMPFLLFAGWLLTGVDTNPENAQLIFRIALTMGMGFILLLAIFPIQVWSSIISEGSNPYQVAFGFFILTGADSLFIVSFLSNYTWLGDSPIISQGLMLTGVVIVAFAGVWSAFQRHLGRIFGFAVIQDIGLTLIIISLSLVRMASGEVTADASRIFQPVQETLYFQLALRVIVMAIWALALSIIQGHVGSLKFNYVQGVGRRMPYALAGILLAQASLAGYPLLAGFTLRISLWQFIADYSLVAALLTLLGNVGIIFASLRSLAVLVMDTQEKPWQVMDQPSHRWLLFLGYIVLIIIGIAPQFITSLVRNVVSIGTLPIP